MKRSPLRRKSPVKPKRKKPRRSGRVRDPKYLEFVRTLPCCAPHVPEFVVLTQPCGQSEAHHAGNDRGYGQKCSDHDTIPLCRTAHAHWHTGTGMFAGWTKERRRDWARDMIIATQARAVAAGVLT